MGATDQESTNAHNVVLLVDDEVSILSALRLLLEPKGFKVIVAANPFAAVKLAVTDQYLGQHVLEIRTPVQLEPYPERRPDRGVRTENRRAGILVRFSAVTAARSSALTS